MRIHDSIITGEAPFPYRYRILVPYFTQGLTELIDRILPLSYRKSWILSYLIYDLIAILLFLATLYIFLRQWHTRLLSLAGVIFCSALLPLSLRDHYYQPWSLIESWFFCVAFLVVRKGKYVSLIPLTLAASLNRMSGLFIPLIYLAPAMNLLPRPEAGYELDLKTFGRFILLAAMGSVSLVALRAFLGWGENIHSVSYLWDLNRSFNYWPYALINIILFAGGWWIFFAAGIRRADRFTLNILPVAFLYLIPVAVFGIWKEVRLLMPLYPVLISTGLFYLREKLPEVPSADSG
jgi:hypothetical protein